MNNNDNFRYTIVLMIILCYFLPITILTTFSISMSPQNSGWHLFTLGLFISAFGSALLFLLINRWALGWQKQIDGLKKADAIPTPSELEMEQERSDVSLELESQLHYLREKSETNDREIKELQEKNDILQEQEKRLNEDLDQLKTSLSTVLAQKENSLQEYHRNMMQERATNENLQKQLTLSEAKERDLTYEIKALLQMSEIATPPLKSLSSKHPSS